MYADIDSSGTTIVVMADMKNELNRQSTGQVNAGQLAWCGNSCLVLTLVDKLAIVGPWSTEYIEVPKAKGLWCSTEIDGL